jgi:hypothetical protein
MYKYTRNGCKRVFSGVEVHRKGLDNSKLSICKPWIQDEWSVLFKHGVMPSSPLETRGKDASSPPETSVVYQTASERMKSKTTPETSEEVENLLVNHELRNYLFFQKEWSFENLNHEEVQKILNDSLLEYEEDCAFSVEIRDGLLHSF